MKVAILEDEKSAAEHLIYHLGEIDPSIKVDIVIDTVSSAIDYFKENPDIELAFFDIHLADSISFDIFKEVKIKIPIIFVTAYDEYALKAFKVNSIDYLLKPIDEEELRMSIEKFKSFKRNVRMPHEYENIIEMLLTVSKKYKSTFLVQQKDNLIPIYASDIAYFTIDASIVKAFTFDGKSFVIYEKLEDIEASLNPEQFFRANRQFIVQRKSIESLTIYFNGKLILNTLPNTKEKIVVSKTKAAQLKNWIHSLG
uniref:LytR/AlgR family response regulator transcription factor n=1 Tax=Flavobacterium sp. TaxID=239 RepID=UPI004049F329